jgi:RHS repeat-associated protein
MTYNNANELTQMANSTQGTTVAFTYDDWGRTASQTVGSNSATYSYKYGSKLASVTSTLFGEQNVAFEYGGDQKRRSMTTGGVTTQYNWDMGWNVINEEDGNGDLARTYTHNPQSGGRATLGHVDGTSPANGAYRYYLHDHLGSTRFVFNDEVDLLATYQYTPYGDILASNNPNTTTHLFTGHDWNPASNLYFAPFRYYSPQTTRWLVRDPLGIVDGPNLYSYVKMDPVNGIDLLGLAAKVSCQDRERICNSGGDKWYRKTRALLDKRYNEEMKWAAVICAATGGITGSMGGYGGLFGGFGACMVAARVVADAARAEGLLRIEKAYDVYQAVCDWLGCVCNNMNKPCEQRERCTKKLIQDIS